MKKLILLLVLVSLVCTASAATNTYWDRDASEGPGNWNDPDNWPPFIAMGQPTGEIDPITGLPIIASQDQGGFPHQVEKVKFNVPNSAECQVTDSQTANQFVQGDGGPGGVIRVMNGGTITGTNAGKWNAVGFSDDAHMIVELGGVVDVPYRMYVGYKSETGGVGTIDISGTLTAAGKIQLGRSGYTGYGIVNVLDGGILNLPGPGDIDIQVPELGSKLDISGTGAIVFPGNVVVDPALLATIYGDGVLGLVGAVYDPGSDTTSLVVVPEPATMILLGLGGVLLRKRR